nr:radical SAM family heme chaperone HemW [uncultured Romboutsia sp.]
MLGLYVHVPFCAQKCNYCDFNSYKIEEKNQKRDYLISIKKEMELYKDEFKNKKITSVFLGGGTPSILTPEELTILMENIYSNFNIDKDAEITMECNPGTLDKVKLKAIKSLGINRLSMGLQVTQDHHLKYIGRIHTYEQFEKNYKDVIEIGIDNINVDLMYSLPNQSFDEWKETLNKIINLNPSHISAYSLILEEGTKFYDMYINKEFELNDEEVDISIYNYTIDTLYKNGYNQYEISNYAKEGYECKHNIVYWKCDNYLGLGPGASGYINNYRYSNICDIKGYNKCLKYNKKPIEEKNTLSKKDEMEEFIFMGLRMNKGINLCEFYEKFNVNFKHKYNNILDKLKNLNLIIEQNNNIALTQRGREISNTVFVEFID